MSDSTAMMVREHREAVQRLFGIFRTGTEDAAITAFQADRESALDDVTGRDTLDRFLCIAFVRGFERLIGAIDELGMNPFTNVRCLAWAFQSGNVTFLRAMCSLASHRLSAVKLADALDAAFSTATSVGADETSAFLFGQLVALHADSAGSQSLYGASTGNANSTADVEPVMTEEQSTLAVVWAPQQALAARARRAKATLAALRDARDKAAEKLKIAQEAGVRAAAAAAAAAAAGAVSATDLPAAARPASGFPPLAKKGFGFGASPFGRSSANVPAAPAADELSSLKAKVDSMQTVISAVDALGFEEKVSAALPASVLAVVDAGLISAEILAAAESALAVHPDFKEFAPPRVSTLILAETVEPRPAQVQNNTSAFGSFSFGRRTSAPPPPPPASPATRSSEAKLPANFTEVPFRPSGRPAGTFPGGMEQPPLEECVIVNLPLRVMMGSTSAVTEFLNRTVVALTKTGLPALGRTAAVLGRADLVRALMTDFALQPSNSLLRAALTNAQLDVAKVIVEEVRRRSIAGEVVQLCAKKVPQLISSSYNNLVERRAIRKALGIADVPAVDAKPGSDAGSSVVAGDESGGPVPVPAPITAGNWAERLFVSSVVRSAVELPLPFPFPGDVFPEAAGTVLPSGAVLPASPALATTSLVDDDVAALEAIDPAGAAAALKACEPVIGGGFVVSLRVYLPKGRRATPAEVDAAIASLLAAAPAPSSKEELEDLVLAVESQRRRALFTPETPVDPRRTEVLRWLLTIPEALAAARAYTPVDFGHPAGRLLDQGNSGHLIGEAKEGSPLYTALLGASLTYSYEEPAPAAPGPAPAVTQVKADPVKADDTDEEDEGEDDREDEADEDDGGIGKGNGKKADNPINGKTASSAPPAPAAIIVTKTINLLHASHAYDDSWAMHNRVVDGHVCDLLRMAAATCDAEGLTTLHDALPGRRTPFAVAKLITVAASRGQFRTVLRLAQELQAAGQHTLPTFAPVGVAPFSLVIARWMVLQGFGTIPVVRNGDAEGELLAAMGAWPKPIGGYHRGQPDASARRPVLQFLTPSRDVGSDNSEAELKPLMCYLRPTAVLASALAARTPTASSAAAAAAAAGAGVPMITLPVLAPVVLAQPAVKHDWAADAYQFVGELAKERLDYAPGAAFLNWAPMTALAARRAHARLLAGGAVDSPLILKHGSAFSPANVSRVDSTPLHPFTHAHPAFSELIAPATGAWARQCPADVLSFARCLALHPLVSTLRILHEHGDLRRLAETSAMVQMQTRFDTNKKPVERVLCQLEAWILYSWVARLQFHAIADRAALIDAALLLQQLRAGVGLAVKHGEVWRITSRGSSSWQHLGRRKHGGERLPVADVAASLEDLQLRLMAGCRAYKYSQQESDAAMAKITLKSKSSRAALSLASSERPWAVKIPSPGTVEYGLFDDGLWAPFSLEVVQAGEVELMSEHENYRYRQTVIRDLWSQESSNFHGVHHELFTALPRLRACFLLGVNPVPAEIAWAHTAVSGSQRAAKLLLDFAAKFDVLPRESRFAYVHETPADGNYVKNPFNLKDFWATIRFGNRQFAELTERTGGFGAGAGFHATPSAVSVSPVAALVQSMTAAPASTGAAAAPVDPPAKLVSQAGNRATQLLTYVAALCGKGRVLCQQQLALAHAMLAAGADPRVLLDFKETEFRSKSALDVARLARGKVPVFNPRMNGGFMWNRVVPRDQRNRGQDEAIFAPSVSDDVLSLQLIAELEAAGGPSSDSGASASGAGK